MREFTCESTKIRVYVRAYIWHKCSRTSVRTNVLVELNVQVYSCVRVCINERACIGMLMCIFVHNMQLYYCRHIFVKLDSRTGTMQFCWFGVVSSWSYCALRPHSALPHRFWSKGSRNYSQEKNWKCFQCGRREKRWRLTSSERDIGIVGIKSRTYSARRIRSADVHWMVAITNWANPASWCVWGRGPWTGISEPCKDWTSDLWF